MKSKWLWVIGLLAMAALAVMLTLRPTAHRGVSVNLVSASMDAAGKRHILYAITNGASRSIEVTVSELETRDRRTGWWWLGGANTRWKVEKNAGLVQDASRARLNAQSAGQFEVNLNRFDDEGSALRGKIFCLRVESQLGKQLRFVAYKLRLPFRWWRNPPIWVDLPTADIRSMSLPQLPPPPPIRSNIPLVGLPSSQPSEEIIPAGLIKFQNVGLRPVLNIYAELADADLDIESSVRKLPATITLQNSKALKRSEVVQLFEEAFEQQAGIMVEHLDKHRISIRLQQHP